MPKKPWGGRFKKVTHKLVDKYTSSIDFDKRLYGEDIEGSIAHAKMLGKQGIISKQESQQIVKALEEIRGEIEKGKFPYREKLEDIHLNIEKRLIEKIGEIGGKLHTARSRNDQVVLDERLYLRREVGEILSLIKDLARAFLDLAEKNIDVIMPAYTHLQRAQPILLSHHLLAYFEMLKRDRERYIDCLKRVNIMTLGAGAVAGTSFPIDRDYVADLLNFPQVTRNSVDTVSDRDFILEFISTSAILIMHLSRLSEELILWSSKEFDFVDLGDEFTTGSSIMPQKRNPDVPELIRGKTGRVYGNLMALLAIMKGLPLSYNRDLQEDKEPMFDTADTVKSSLHVLSEMMKHIKYKSENMRKALSKGFATATDLSDYLTRKGTPFRKAHEVTGKIVRYAEEKERELIQLNISELKMFSSLFEGDVFDHITIEGSISSKKSYGGTAKENVLKMIQECQKELAKW
ncbi:MAG TPA: argininosuccinate lyase [Thermodesulfobacteriota bacterium]|nr:argininosuccinate lyase [Thermodesulfobacteriota bacterium]